MDDAVRDIVNKLEGPMTSAEINDGIRALEARQDLDFEAFGGKKIPYIGWFWREVNFDVENYTQWGYIDDDNEHWVGFMENNKWGYGYCRSTPDEWQAIKRTIVRAIKDPTVERLAVVNELIQALGRNRI